MDVLKWTLPLLLFMIILINGCAMGSERGKQDTMQENFGPGEDGFPSVRIVQPDNQSLPGPGENQPVDSQEKIVEGLQDDSLAADQADENEPGGRAEGSGVEGSGVEGGGEPGNGNDSEDLHEAVDYADNRYAELNLHSYETRKDGAVRITDKILSAQNPAFSPDGRRMVFTHFRSGYNEGKSDLNILDLETGDVETLISDGNSNVNLPGSCWVGDDIVFSSTKDPHDEIYVIDSVSDAVEQLTSREDLVAYEPSFSPDGRRVVFESHEYDVEDDGVIVIYDIVDGSYTEITNSKDDCRQPNWSPDGKLIVYQKLQNRQWDLWVYDLALGIERRLTSGAGDKTDASFSPDSSWVVYSADNEDLEYANLFAIPATGGIVARITHHDGYDGAPSWSPDGRWIVFEAYDGDPDGTGGTEIWAYETELLRNS